MIRTFPIVSLASLLALGSPLVASAQPVPTPVQWGQAYPRGDSQRVYDDGYRSGLREGERDARDGRRPDYRDQNAYRRGSNGGWGLGNSGNQDVFRRGFAEGYQDGYQRFRGSYGNNNRYPAYPDGGYRPQGGYSYPDAGYGYPGGSYGYPGGAYGSAAVQRGFEDGYNEGRKDAHGNDRYEPTRKKKYRQADDGYNNRYGSKDQYRDAYRQGFQQGYDRGYREARYR